MLCTDRPRPQAAPGGPATGWRRPNYCPTAMELLGSLTTGVIRAGPDGDAEHVGARAAGGGPRPIPCYRVERKDTDMMPKTQRMRSGALIAVVILALGFGACSDNGSPTEPTPPTVEEEDRQTLVALYNALDGPNWGQNTNWLTSEPLSTWYGVRDRRCRTSCGPGSFPERVARPDTCPDRNPDRVAVSVVR